MSAEAELRPTVADQRSSLEPTPYFIALSVAYYRLSQGGGR